MMYLFPIKVAKANTYHVCIYNEEQTDDVIEQYCFNTRFTNDQTNAKVLL